MGSDGTPGLGRRYSSWMADQSWKWLARVRGLQHSHLLPCSPSLWKHVVPSAVLADNIPRSSSCCSACKLQNINDADDVGDCKLWREMGCTAGAAFLLSRSLLLALKCPQAPLPLCTSCPLVFAALAPCLSRCSEMCPLDTHLNAALLLLSLSQLAWRGARSC